MTIITYHCLKKAGLNPDEQAYAIQGMGNVGGTAARIFYETGKKIVAVGDWSGGVYKEDGLNILEISAYLSDRSHCLKDYRPMTSF